MIGRRIGQCEIIHRLGEGGVGHVYAGIDRSLDRAVAIKALRPEHSGDAGFAARFRAEAGALAALHHPTIAGIYSLEQCGGELFMILELVRGLTLEQVLVDGGALSETACLAVAAQALVGLGVAHAEGIVHRDIKPGNIMLTPQGTLKLMDFGIAHMRGKSRMTRQGSLVGTLAYMSPEQIRGGEGTPRSDLYSLGIVLYEALTGRPPFEADTEYDLLRAQVELPPPPLRERLPQLSPHIADGIMRCLEKDPAARFENVEDLTRQLGVHALGDRPEAIIGTHLGAKIAEATAPLIHLIDQARRRSRPRLEDVSDGAATRLVTQPGSWEPVAQGTVLVPPHGGRRYAAAALAATFLIVLGLVTLMLAEQWQAAPIGRSDNVSELASPPLPGMSPEAAAPPAAASQAPAPHSSVPEAVASSNGVADAGPRVAPPALPMPSWPPPEPIPALLDPPTASTSVSSAPILPPTSVPSIATVAPEVATPSISMTPATAEIVDPAAPPAAIKQRTTTKRTDGNSSVRPSSKSQVSGWRIND